MRLQGSHVYIRGLELEDAEPLLQLRIKNREFMKPFEPIRPDSHFTLESHKEQIAAIVSDRENDKGYTFGVFLNDTDEIIGRVALTGVARGPWQNVNIGYFMDQDQNGKGYTTEAVNLAVQFAFEEAKLHRVQGAVMPHNIASIRVLEKAEFCCDGLSRNYLKINGVWEDHKIFSIINYKLE